MSSLIIFALVVAAIWTPHVVRGIVSRLRYRYRQHIGYMGAQS